MPGKVPGKKYRYVLLLVAASLLLSGCSSFLASSGPSRAMVLNAETKDNTSGIMVIEVTGDVARRLLENKKVFHFSSLASECPKGGQYVGPGDIVDVTIWETPPAALFFNTTSDLGVAPNAVAPMRFPEQQIGGDGKLSVPFAGQVNVTGRTLREIEAEICSRLKGRANDPQVQVRLVKNTSSTATIVGEVDTSCVVSLTPKCERILDALAAAEGATEAVNKLMIQLTRAGNVYSMPLQEVIASGRDNINLLPGDVITVLYRPNSFTALGATGHNTEIEFEATGITLAQALARAGGPDDNKADPRGVFLFRFEPVDAMQWPKRPEIVTPENTVPVIYTVNLMDPATFFAAQSFPIKDNDVLYISNAPGVELKKFLSILSTIVSPALSTTSQVRTLTNTGAWK